uniref:RNB domain-containing protein n=1 Tax=viral metagenome TaxID=1070528 RepID=A0A6C0JP21_9ZZZZ
MTTKIVKIYVRDRTYNTWSFAHNDTNTPITVDECPILKTIQPAEQKIFSRDVFEVSDINREPTIRKIHSYVRNFQSIAGILVLENNKTFGRTTNKKRLLYKCIPDDKYLPVFLIPYEVKTGFSKVQKNKYVVFRFDNWDDKHPHGIITETIGDVDVLEHFYEYQLYSNSLHISITEFTNKARSVLNKKSTDEFVQQIMQNPNYVIEDRRDKYVFTIDPLNSLDYDDGFGIEAVGDNWRVSIYIANVFLWLEALGLWNSFSQRVATIYLPDRRRPMLPTVLSDALCSLQQNKPRFALAMDIMIDSCGNLLSDNPISYASVLINVSKNYVYEDSKMITNDVAYQRLFDVSYLMDNSIRNSHDIVAHWMVHMNLFTGSYMSSNKIGIFRSVVYIDSILNENVNGMSDDTFRVIRGWNNTSSHYIPYTEEVTIEHQLISSKMFNGESNVYIHITSPIRRLVDLLNQTLILKNRGLVKNITVDAVKFIEKWMNELDYINTSMRLIRKIQTECELLNRVHNQPNLLDSEHDGVVFDKIMKSDGSINYMIYLEKIKLLSRINTHCNMPNFTNCQCRIYLFEDEDKVKKKIRVQII